MYEVQEGDTFELIAKKIYGDESRSLLLISGNPGIFPPLEKGILIRTPDDPAAPADLLAALFPSDSPDDVILLIEGTRFHFWEQIEIKMSIDSVDAVVFSAPFEPQNAEFKSKFKPFSYAKVGVSIGSQTLFSGTMIGVDPSADANKRTVNVSAYSKPGVLQDCTFPASVFPVEFNGQNLSAIAASLASPFGLAVDFLEEPGAIFPTVGLKTGEKILTFLAGLAKKRNLIIHSTRRGRLEFYKPIGTATPIARFNEGSTPLVSISQSFQPQGYFSDLTGIEPAVVGAKGGTYTVRNDKLQDTLRPFTFDVADTETGGIKNAVLSKAGRMFGQMVTYTITIDTWRDSFGQLIRPNTTVNLFAPAAMIYKEFSFIVKTVTLRSNKEQKSAVLELVLPGSFSGEIPGALPWDE